VLGYQKETHRSLPFDTDERLRLETLVVLSTIVSIWSPEHAELLLVRFHLVDNIQMLLSRTELLVIDSGNALQLQN